MKRFLLAPDSFKGTMSAEEVCAIWREAILARVPDASVTQLPMADGGEGMTASYLSILGGTRVSVRVTGPLGAPVDGFYGVLPDGSAVVEMAAAAGLPLTGGVLRPLTASTFGVGELILHAAQNGAKRILLGLGGSATNDCGVGMAAALGWRFLDSNGVPVEPLAENLLQISHIIPPQTPLPCTVTAACDVQNPLLGSAGATAVYGPQKGVTQESRAILEEGLSHLASVIERDLGVSVSDIAGAGAAGGLGAGVLAFLSGKLCSGIQLLLDTAHFDELLLHTDAVFTGEGRIDAQSVNGKVLMGVGARCQRAGVPCIALCGSVGDGAEKLYAHGITAAFSAIRTATDFAGIQRTCREDMRLLTDSVLRLMLL